MVVIVVVLVMSWLAAAPTIFRFIGRKNAYFENFTRPIHTDCTDVDVKNVGVSDADATDIDVTDADIDGTDRHRHRFLAKIRFLPVTSTRIIRTPVGSLRISIVPSISIALLIPKPIHSGRKVVVVVIIARCLITIIASICVGIIGFGCFDRAIEHD